MCYKLTNLHIKFFLKIFVEINTKDDTKLNLLPETKTELCTLLQNIDHNCMMKFYQCFSVIDVSQMRDRRVEVMSKVKLKY